MLASFPKMLKTTRLKALK